VAGVPFGGEEAHDDDAPVGFANAAGVAQQALADEADALTAGEGSLVEIEDV
jgi:hypothetical protein